MNNDTKFAIAGCGLLMIMSVIVLLVFAASVEQNVQHQLESTAQAREGTLRVILMTNTWVVYPMLPSETPRQFKTQASP